MIRTMPATLLLAFIPACSPSPEPTPIPGYRTEEPYVPGVRTAGGIGPVENIHIHPFVTRLLGLDPAADIDGRFDVLIPYLRAPAPALGGHR